VGGEKLLLTGVFGPYGVKNRYAEALGMQMELLNNQITRMQGVHSPRQSYWTFPLYLMAENISVDTTVLDFPRWNDFKNELKKGYTHVGINFILPNALKAKRMAEYIREKYPRTKIILGGYGAVIPGIENLMPFDALCKGEGVHWLRRYFGNRIDVPIKHPVIHGPAYEKIYGYSGKPKGSILMPGVGCENACKFCATSHQFEKKYFSLLSGGRDVFEACRQSEEKLGSTGFSIMDENFLKHPERARELLQFMTEHKKPYVFDIFSSAEVIKKMGVDFLVRLGVRMIWVGVESKYSSHDKTKGINVKSLVDELRSKGIIVNASTILFLDHHNEETIREEIDWVISLNSDLIQFMNYTPLPSTTLHNDLKADGRLKRLECRHIHGAGELAFEHPHFKDRKVHVSYLKNAFKKKYVTDGPGIVNMAITAVQGLEKARFEYRERQEAGMAWNPETLQYEKNNCPDKDEFMILRIRKMERIAMNIRPILLPAFVFGPNRNARKKVRETAVLYRKVLGPPGFKVLLMSSALVVTGVVEQVRLWINRLMGRESIVYNPRSKVTEYRGNKELERKEECCRLAENSPIPAVTVSGASCE